MFVFGLAEKQKLPWELAAGSAERRRAEGAAGLGPARPASAAPRPRAPPPPRPGDAHRGSWAPSPLLSGASIKYSPSQQRGVICYLFIFFFKYYYYRSCNSSSIHVKQAMYFCNGWLRNITAQCSVLWLDE